MRFEKLLRDFRAGRLIALPDPADRLEPLPQLPGLPGLPPPYRAPRDFGPLLRLAPESAAFAGQVEYLLADPEMKALLAGSAQAGRMLRPLCRMLGIQSGLEVLAPPRGVRPRGGVQPASLSHPPPHPSLSAARGGEGDQASSLPRRLPIRTPIEAEAGADPPLNVPWRRAERG